MGEPTYRLLTGDDLWVSGDALNGSILGGALLPPLPDGVIGRLEVSDD